MKSEPTTQPAEGIRDTEKRKAEIETPPPFRKEKRKAEIPTLVVPQPEEEQLVLEGMMQCLCSLKRSRRPGVAKAAREWEGVIGFRLRMTMQERKRRASDGRARTEDGRRKAEGRKLTAEGRGQKAESGRQNRAGTSSGLRPPASQSGEGGSKATPIASPSVLRIRVSVSPNQD